MNIQKTIAFLILSLSIASGTWAQESASGDFEKRQKSLSGSWTIETQGGDLLLTLSQDFKASNGPDLKIFLSPNDFQKVNGRNAVNGSVLVAELTRTKGAQTYKLPPELQLSDFKSLLIHCEKYSVLWGGSSL
ncbi:MAG: DM13 domain-containing protein [Verrucomicrobiota bacterium]